LRHNRIIRGTSRCRRRDDRRCCGWHGYWTDRRLCILSFQSFSTKKLKLTGGPLQFQSVQCRSPGRETGTSRSLAY
jgi:hypothetical protein